MGGAGHGALALPAKPPGFKSHIANANELERRQQRHRRNWQLSGRRRRERLITLGVLVWNPRREVEVLQQRAVSRGGALRAGIASLCFSVAPLTPANPTTQKPSARCRVQKGKRVIAR